MNQKDKYYLMILIDYILQNFILMGCSFWGLGTEKTMTHDNIFIWATEMNTFVFSKWRQLFINEAHELYEQGFI